jgi:hypothetical protein
VSLGLHERAHNSVDGMQGVVMGVGYHGGDDGVVGAFSGGDGIWMIRGELEVSAAVLEDKSTVFGDYSGAETVEIAVDEGDGVSFLVGTGEIDCVTVVMGRGAAVVDFVRGLERVKEFGSFGEVGFGEELRGWVFGVGCV